jgi:heptosyltransferase-2
MALPALARLADRYDDMDLWSHPRVAGLLPVFFPEKDVFTGSRIPNGRERRLLLMTGSFRSALQGVLSRIPERTGYGTDMRRLLLTESLDPPRDRDHHHSEDYIALARSQGCTDPVDVPDPSVSPCGSEHIALFPGAEYGSAKKWPRYGGLAAELGEMTGLPVVLYGSGREEEELRVTAMGIAGCTVCAGLDLPSLVSRLMKSVLTVGNDSGGVHLSALLGSPTLTLFGSTSPSWTAPSGRMTAMVTSGADCSPCFRRVCPEGEPRCMDEIGHEMVVEEAIRLLRRSEGADDA